MRIGSKNTKLAVKTKTRRCVVRVKRMKPQPSRNNKRTVAAKPEPQSLKKRPTGPASVAAARLSSSLSKSFKAKDRVRPPAVVKNAKVVEQVRKAATPVVEELPPTIAAGRSRRAHKPNPKYANEDLLTPKSLKPSALSNLDDGSNKASNDSEHEGPRSTKAAKSSSKYQVVIETDSDYEENNEDSDSSQFERVTRSRPTKAAPEPVARRSAVGGVSTTTLNRTAPNAKSVPTQLQQLRRTLNASNLSPLAMGKKRKLEESSTSATPVLPNKRPNTAASAPTVAAKRQPTVAASTPVGATKKPIVAASTPIGATRKPSVAVSTPIAAAKKLTATASTPILASRKPNSTTSTPAVATRKLPSQASTPVVASRKPLITTATQKLSENNGIMKRRQSPSIGASDSKIKTNLSTTARDAQDKKSASSLSLDKKLSPIALTRSASVANLKSMTSNKTQQNALQRGIVGRNSLSKATSASTPSLSKSNVGQSPNATPPSTTASKTRSSLTKPNAPANKQQSKDDTKKASDGYASSDIEETPTITIDDFETMPTFTIVNINDIINKKGDVLISEAADNSKSKSAKSSESGRNVQKQQTPPQSQQNSKMQTQSSKQPVKKPTSESVKTQASQQFSTSTPLAKKPVEKVANKIINRNSSGTTKPSPPSLKATVTQPVTTRPTTRSANASEKKPAPRILNSIVSPRTKPIKPVINNLDVSDDDPSGSISLYTDEEEDFDDDDDDDEFDGSRFTNASILESDDDEDTGNESSEAIESPKKRVQAKRSPASAAAASGKGKVSTPPNAAKENSAAANNCLPKKQAPQAKQQSAARKLSPEKVVVQREGNKIIKKITCFETWYVINIPADAPEEYERNTLDMPLIDLANCAKEIQLPSDIWTTKVTLYEVRKSPKELNLPLYNGDLTEQKIKESDRAKYQPSCVMFRRTVPDRVKLQLPYDRAVIFKNKTFFTNIEGKNVKLVGAPTSIKEASEVETLLNIVDGLTLQSPFVEPAATIL